MATPDLLCDLAMEDAAVLQDAFPELILPSPVLLSPDDEDAASEGGECLLMVDDDHKSTGSMSCGSSSPQQFQGAGVSAPTSPGLDVEMGDEAGTSGEIVVENGNEHELQGEHGWVPGRSCQGWVDTHHPLSEQGRVLVINACLVAGRLPQEVLRAAVKHMGKRKTWAPQAWQLVSGLLCISLSTVKSVMQAAKACKGIWSPCPLRKQAHVEPHVAEAGFSASVEAGLSADSLPLIEPAFLATVRMAVANAAEGRPHAAFERDIIRVRLGGSDLVGASSRYWAREVAAIASMVLAQMDAVDFDMPVPGLGIPSDFCLLADAVAVGDSIMSRHGDLLIICLAIASAHNGQAYHPMLAAPCMKIGEHGGQACASAILRACTEHPVSWDADILRARLAGIGGDGALCVGGPSARHKSSGAAEHLWNMVHEEANLPGAGLSAPRGVGSSTPRGVGSSTPTCTTWDPFHRLDVAVWRAIRQHTQVLSIFDISREVDYLFGQSEGVLIFRGVAECIEEKPVSVRAPGGTRKIVYLSGVPGSLLENYKTIRAGLHARVAWKQAGHSSQKLSHILDVARRFSEVRFCIILMLMQDLLGGLLRPFARQVQGHMEASVFHRAQVCTLKRIDAAIGAIGKLRILIRVISLCRQHLTSQEAATLCAAFGGFSPCSSSDRRERPRKEFEETSSGVSPATWRLLLQRRELIAQFGTKPLSWGSAAAYFPSFFEHVPRLLMDNPVFRGCKVLLTPDFDSSTHILLGAHCQCASREKFFLAESRNARGAQSEGAGFSAPVWVAYPPATAKTYADAPNLIDVAPRCVILPKERKKVPRHSCTNMFRHNLPRCKLLQRELLMDKEIDAGLDVVSKFLSTMSTEVEHILTSVGVNASMSALLDSARLCWDWQRLALARPTADDVRAFRKVSMALRPLLQNTMYPTDTAFSSVEHIWISDDELCIEYVHDSL